MKMDTVATLFEDERAPRGSTPLMRQYYAIKDQHPNAILLFRMGDFYETFAEDARIVSDVLGITLTRRSNGKAADVALAGFPHHALDSYLPKLIRSGLRVAVCEQLEDPKTAKTIVKRGVTEIVTPGVAFRDELLDPTRSNYVAAMTVDTKSGSAGVAFLEASTGDFFLAEGPKAEMERVLQNIAPTELLLTRANDDVRSRWQRLGVVVTDVEDWMFGYEFAFESLTAHFETQSLKGFGVERERLGIAAAGSVLHYVTETQKGRVPQVTQIRRYRNDAFMLLDAQTRRNLDLVDSGPGASLVGLLDETKTPMGARLFRSWLLHPLVEAQVVNQRLEAVALLVDSDDLRERLRDELDGVGDLERLVTRNLTGRSSPRDLVALALGLERAPKLRALAKNEPALAGHAPLEHDVHEVVELIRRALDDDPAPLGSNDRTLRAGYSAELDEVRTLAREGRSIIAGIQQREAARTGITSLKVGFNKVFGYYLEVTNAQRKKVPQDYIRKQTLVNAERYVTPELKETEEKILAAQERMSDLEATLFSDLRERVAKHSRAMSAVARDIATLDVLCSFAVASRRRGFSRPVVDDGLILEIEEGRHPVVEASLPPGEPFIPNTIRMDPASEQILVITGPNMAGKSVVLRQVGIIVLLAQVGCFVPAAGARVGIIDRIFTRVGASDNLAEGESTFLVEMNETANILNNATPRSLILLDEVGRGTSTFDGLSIAWAIVEHLHDEPDVAAKTLFATHYHELNELAARLDRVKNYRVLVQEHSGRVIFLRKLVAGGADHSYGIEVARMAGLPHSVVERARQVLDHLESAPLVGITGDGGIGDLEAARRHRAESPATGRSDALALEIESVDLNRLTPIEALVKLNELKELTRKK